MRSVVTKNANSTIIIVRIDIGKIRHSFSRFSPTACRLEVDSPSSIFDGRVLGYPTSFLVDTWQANVGALLPFPALDNGLACRCNSHFQN